MRDIIEFEPWQEQQKKEIEQLATYGQSEDDNLVKRQREKNQISPCLGECKINCVRL